MSKPSSRSVVRTLLALYLIGALSLGPVAAAETAAGASADERSPAALTAGLDDDLLNETTDDTTNTTDDTTNTTDSLNETTDDTTDTVDSTSDSFFDTTDSLFDTFETTTDGTLNTTDSTFGETTDSLNDTTDTFENTTDSTLDDTTDSLDDTTDSLTGTTDETVGETTTGITDITGAAMATLDEPTEETLESLEVSAAVLPDSEIDSQSTANTTVTDDRPGSGRADETTPADEKQTTAQNASAGAGADGGDGLPTIPEPAALGLGAVVIGAAGLTALSASGSGMTQSPGLLRATALRARGAATGARALLSALGDKLWRLGAMLRYSRWDDSDPLEHDVRRDIFDTVEDAPGIYLSKLDEQTDRSLSSLRHHLRILEEEGLITTEKVRGKRRYFPVKRGAEDPALIAALDDPATEAILTTLADEGPASGGDLADSLDRDPSTVSHHLSRLEEEGLIERERDGRAVVNELSDSAAMALSDAPAATGDQVAPADD